MTKKKVFSVVSWEKDEYLYIIKGFKNSDEKDQQPSRKMSKR